MLREKASLHEGHGFSSRAIKGLPTTALAPEVRYDWNRPDISRYCFAIGEFLTNYPNSGPDLGDVPSGLGAEFSHTLFNPQPFSTPKLTPNAKN
jgi:hypothetical protein